jgi:tRNA A37 threonylcarbamoyladenosine synthetase subunit TsaC/SUA5/YrdC
MKFGKETTNLIQLKIKSKNCSSYYKKKPIQKEFDVLWNELDLIIDGGVLSNNEEAKAGSTVIDLTEKETYKIIRNGR